MNKRKKLLVICLFVIGISMFGSKKQVFAMESEPTDSNILISKKDTIPDDLEYIERYENETTDNMGKLKKNEPVTYTYEGSILTAYNGVNYGPQGKETYYNLNMSGVVQIMRNMGYEESDYPYWVREDGCKMLGPYIMVAANLNTFPRGSVIECSLGTAIVCDTGEFAAYNPTQLDIATDW